MEEEKRKGIRHSARSFLRMKGPPAADFLIKIGSKKINFGSKRRIAGFFANP